MEHLFNEYEAMNARGTELAERAEALLRPLLMEFWGSGAAMRDVESIVHSSVHGITAEIVLRAAVNKRRAERQ